MNEFDKNLRHGFEALQDVAGEWRYITTLTKTGKSNPHLALVIWSTEGLDNIKMRGAYEGVFYAADVLMTIDKHDLKAIPKPGLILTISEDDKSTSGTNYRVIKITPDYDTYALALVRNT